MAGSSNFQQWNPTSSNQETDSQYTADALRSGGAATDNILPSITFNKFAYQVTTFVAAFGLMMSNKGFSLSDTNLPALATVLSNIITTADRKSDLQTVVYSPVMTFDCSQADNFQCTLTGNVSQLNIVNGVPGQVIGLTFIQDSAGGHTVSIPANGASAILSDAYSTNNQSFEFRSDLSLHAITAMVVS